MFLGDSRSPSGPGLLPAQDFRTKLEVDALAGVICHRIVDDIDKPVMRWREEEQVHGLFRGLMVWMPYGETSVRDTNPPAKVPASLLGQTGIALRPIGASRWQTIFPVTAIGEDAPIATTPGKSAPIDERQAPDKVAAYHPVGSQPNQITRNGVTYTLVSSTPQKTYTNQVGIEIGSYVYARSGPVDTGSGWVPKSATKAPDVPAPPPGYGYAQPPDSTYPGLPDYVYIEIELSPAPPILPGAPSAPPAPQGFSYTGTIVTVIVPGGIGSNGTVRFTYQYKRDTVSGGGSAPPPQNPNHGTGDPERPGSAGGGPGLTVSPTFDTTYAPDPRFHPHAIPLEDRKPYWNRFPRGTFGVVLQTMDDERQVEDFLPTDPRLIAVNNAGGDACGTLVCDLGTKSEFDHTRMARLHSAFRVIYKPAVPPAEQTSDPVGSGNALALQFGVSGQLDSPGGFVFDRQVIAKWSHHDGGCMHVGTYVGDKHIIGHDGDRNTINAMHLSTLGCFTTGQIERDGPLHFEELWPEPVDDGDFAIRVHMGWNPNAQYRFRGRSMKGMWGWWTKILVGEETPSDPPPPPVGDGPRTPEDPPPPPPGRGPTTPGGEPQHGGGNVGGPSTGGGAGTGTVFTATSDRPSSPRVVDSYPQITAGSSKYNTTHRRPAVIAKEVSLPSLVARPQRYVVGEPDVRYVGAATSAQVEDYLRTAPVTGRLSAWGQQKDVGFGCTQRPGYSRHRAGTGNGGWCLMPPEVGLEDLGDSLAPQGVTRSSTYFAIAPGAALGFGLPDLATGTMKSSIAMTADGSGGMSFVKYDASAVTTALGGISNAGVVTLPVSVVRETSGPTSLTVGSVSDGQFLKRVGSTIVGAAAGGSGTVTSVGLAAPTAEFSVSGSPVTASGTLTFSWKTQSANVVFAGPSSGGAAAPTFRGLVAADLPAVDANTGLTGTTLKSSIVTSSLAAVGTIVTGAWQGTPVDVSYGGTGATDAGTARSNLGCGTVATKAIVGAQADSVAATVADLKTDFNALLAKMRSSGVLAT